MALLQLGLGVLFAVASAVSLAVLDVMGVPWTGEILGFMMSASALAFLWLVERRDARMGLLLQEAMRRVVVIDDGIEAAEGDVVLLTAEIEGISSSHGLLSQRWGLEAPAGAAGLAVKVESYRPLLRCSWQSACCCQRGEWRTEDVDETLSSKVFPLQVRVGSLSVDCRELELLDWQCWEAFAPIHTERLLQILHGAPNRTLASLGEALGFTEALPFPDEKPLLSSTNSKLFYPRGGGTPLQPCFGDVQVTFLHIPRHSLFTAVGVRRGDCLENFRYKLPPPEGISLGQATSEDFNAGIADVSGYQAAPSQEPEEIPPGDALINDPKELARIVTAGGAGEADSSQWPIWLPLACRSFLAAFFGSLEPWRQILHRAAPESLSPALLPGHCSRCSFFLRAWTWEQLLTWRLRGLGFSLVASGFQVAFLGWEARSGPFAGALWMVTLLAASGFTISTSALASLFYRPLHAAFCLVCATALFLKLFGVISVLIATGCVVASMSAIVLLFILHFAVPC